MSDNTDNYALKACEMILRPVIRILLRNGVTYRDVVSLVKTLFVDVAEKDFGIRGRPTNISRMAILTGLDRKEIRRVKNLIAEEGGTLLEDKPTGSIARILTGWYQDAEYVSLEGVPKELPYQGETSLTQLMRKYGGDIPLTALFKELKQNKVIEETSSGNWRVLRRYYIPPSLAPQAVLRAGEVVGDFADTLRHNLYEVSPRKVARFERRAINRKMAPSVVPKFNAFVKTRGQEFLEEIDAWLSEYEHSEKTEEDYQLLGLGIYQIQSNNKNSEE